MSQLDDELCQSAARPNPGRADIEIYPLLVESQGRYGDMDANGHVNNLALEALHEDVRARLNVAVLPGIYDPGRRQFRLVSAQNVVHFLAESSWPARFMLPSASAESGVRRSSRRPHCSSAGAASARATPSW